MWLGAPHFERPVIRFRGNRHLPLYTPGDVQVLRTDGRRGSTTLMTEDESEAQPPPSRVRRRHVPLLAVAGLFVVVAGASAMAGWQLAGWPTTSPRGGGSNPAVMSPADVSPSWQLGGRLVGSPAVTPRYVFPTLKAFQPPQPPPLPRLVCFPPIGGGAPICYHTYATPEAGGAPAASSSATPGPNETACASPIVSGPPSSSPTPAASRSPSAVVSRPPCT
jgi:hypothetical protein